MKWDPKVNITVSDRISLQALNTVNLLPVWHLNTYNIINLISSITVNGSTKCLTYPCEGILFFWKHKLGVGWTEEYNTVNKIKNKKLISLYASFDAGIVWNIHHMRKL